MSTVDSEVVRHAEQVLFVTKLRLLEQQALATMSRQPGLALARLWPPSPVIQIVACNGVHLGRVRRDRSWGIERWFAVPPGPRRADGPYPSAWAAAHALLDISMVHTTRTENR